MEFEIENLFLSLHLYIWGFCKEIQYDNWYNNDTSRVRLSSPPTCHLRQGGKNDDVNQQLKE